MTTKTSKSSELHGAAAASQEKAQQTKDAAAKGVAKSSGSGKSSAGAGGKANAKKSR